MEQKFVVRLLDAQGELLAWAEVWAEPAPQARGASCPFWPKVRQTVLPVERDGLATEISVHWCELDVARRQQLLEPMPVTAGQAGTFHWLEPVWLVPGMRDVPLPAVTERASVTITVPTGVLTALSPG
jgi:hypothetical protein